MDARKPPFNVNVCVSETAVSLKKKQRTLKHSENSFSHFLNANGKCADHHNSVVVYLLFFRFVFDFMLRGSTANLFV